MATMHSRAPVRIDFAGGWTDVELFCTDKPGYVVNAAITIYSYASLREQTHRPLVSKNLTLYSADYDATVEAPTVYKLAYDGKADLVKAALKRMYLEPGFDLVTRSESPLGSGLGGSASMGVAALGVLAAYKQECLLGRELAELASLIEREELHIRGGKQDHYASALGGISFMEFRGPTVIHSRLNVPREVVAELQKNLVLCYTGKSRVSGDIHECVTQAFTRREPKTLEAMDSLRRITVSMKLALMRGYLPEFAKLMDENWQNQKRLHPSVTNEQIERLFEVAYGAGALGGKACGAGGGGCLVFYAESDKEHALRKALEQAGAQVLNFAFDFQGLQTWTA